MYRFLLGFSLGVYIGTYYDCKPIINHLEEEIRKVIPREK